MITQYVAGKVDEMGDPRASGWPPDGIRKYDRITFTDLLRAQGASPDAVRLLKLVHDEWDGDGNDAASALWRLRSEALRRRLGLANENSGFFLKGGNDLLPRAFAARLKEKIHYGSPVVRIEQDGQGVRAHVSRLGERETIAADYLVCAIPFSVLRSIEVAPPLSDPKRNAVDRMPYTSVVRVYFQARNRFWSDRGLKGWAVSDGPVVLVADATAGQPGPRGVLHGYVSGGSARRVAQMPEQDRLRFTLDEIDKLYPLNRQYLEGGFSLSWDEDPWVKGAYSWFKPGQLTSFLPHVATPEGRIHFAGEHTSAWDSSMNSALESGIRAAQEINDIG